MSTFLFTYGTLRPSGTLDDLTPGRHVGTGVLPGQLYRHHRASFPVLCDLGPEDPYSLVVGDVFEIPTHHSRSLDFILDMEAGAGYDVRIRTVAMSDDGREIPCIVFVWPDRFPVGPRIYGGDWLSTEARTVCSDIGSNAGFTARTYR